MRVSSRRKLFVVVLLVFGVFLIYYNEDIKITSFETNFRSWLKLKDYLDENQNIFFTETGYSTDNVIIDTRSACGVESAAVTNPDKRISVIFPCFERFENLQSTPVLEALRSYPNVHIFYMNMTQLAMGSPMEEYIRKGDWLEGSRFKPTHTSDVLRLLLLWKYSGTYLDMDMVVRKPVDMIPPNYACAQDGHQVNGAILNFDSKQGRELVELFMEAVMSIADGWNHGGYGPKIVEHVTQKICEVSNTTEVVRKKYCKGFTIIEKSLCYEISYASWRMFAEDYWTAEAMRRLENSIFVHTWSSLWDNRTIDVNSNVAYIQLARQFCPKVLASCGDTF